MKKLGIGVVGAGYIGASHLETARRIGFAELVGVTGGGAAKAKAEEYGVPKVYQSLEEMLEDPQIDIVHNCTPNAVHLEINKKVIKSGKHIFSEKPLAMNTAETSELVAFLKKHPDTVGGVNFNYRMNPLVQDMKNRIAAGEIGKPVLVHGSYLQDWLLFDTDYNWRVDEERGGASRCVADIGSHWMDSVQTVVGSRIVEVCANLRTAHPVRKKPTQSVETFSVNSAGTFEERQVTTEDYAGVLVNFENGATGVFQCSQVSSGRKCFLNFEINGEKASFYWCQERADEMWKGNRDTNNELIMRNPNFMLSEGRKYSSLAAGHPEGWNDGLKNNIYAFYAFIAEGKKLGIHKPDFATFEDAHYITRLTEAILKSGKEKRWVHIDEV